MRLDVHGTTVRQLPARHAWLLAQSIAETHSTHAPRTRSQTSPAPEHWRSVVHATGPASCAPPPESHAPTVVAATAHISPSRVGHALIAAFYRGMYAGDMCGARCTRRD